MGIETERRSNVYRDIRGFAADRSSRHSETMSPDWRAKNRTGESHFNKCSVAILIVSIFRRSGCHRVEGALFRVSQDDRPPKTSTLRENNLFPNLLIKHITMFK